MFKKYFIFLGVFLFLVRIHSAQTVLADSLSKALQKYSSTEERNEALVQLLAEFRYSPDSTFKYGQKLLQARELDLRHLASAHFYLGQAYHLKGEYEKSVDHLFQSSNFFHAANLSSYSADIALAGVYGKIGDVKKASLYFHKAIDQSKTSSDIVATYNNFAQSFYDNHIYDSAYFYFHMARDSARSNAMRGYDEFLTGNIGMVNLKLGRLDSAEKQLQVAVNEFKGSNNLSASLAFESLLAEVYYERGEYDKATPIVKSVIDKASLADLKAQLRDSYHLLSKIGEKENNYELSLEAFKNYVALEDSIKDIEVVRRIGNMQTEYEVGQKQAELDLVNEQRRTERIILYGVVAAAIVFVSFGLILLRLYREKSRLNLKLEEQKTELEDQKEILENQKVELESLNETKDKFFSIISHDLRGPVSSFFGISRMIKFLVENKATDSLLEIADDIDESVDKLSKLLDGLLNWASQQRGRIPYEPEKIQLKSISDDLVKTLSNMAKGKKIDLKSEVNGDIELFVDKNTTMTIIRNLVNNSLKFTDEGGEVKITASQFENMAILKVIDNGVGMSPEKMEGLFKLSGERSTYGTSGEKGLGLGLQLVKEFAELNKGSVSVESEEGKGTTFMVNLPLFQQ